MVVSNDRWLAGVGLGNFINMQVAFLMIYLLSTFGVNSILCKKIVVLVMSRLMRMVGVPNQIHPYIYISNILVCSSI